MFLSSRKSLRVNVAAHETFGSVKSNAWSADGIDAAVVGGGFRRRGWSWVGRRCIGDRTSESGSV